MFTSIALIDNVAGMTLVMAVLVPVCLYRIFKWYRQATYFKIFDTIGLHGPKPDWLYGNALDLNRDDRHLVVREWSQRYGSIFGCYNGTSPMIVISDLHMVENIAKKQVSSFDGRHMASFQPTHLDLGHPLMNLMFAPRAHSKIVRKASSPFFNMRNLQHCIPLMESKTEQFLTQIPTNGKAFDCREPFQLLAMDTLCEFAFGFKLNLLDKTSQQGMKIYQQAKMMVENGVVSESKFTKFINLFPICQSLVRILVHLIMKFSAGPLGPVTSMKEMILSHSRVENANERPNLLHRLCRLTDFGDKCLKNSSDNESSGELMSQEQLMTNLVTFAISGFETTSTSLAYACHCLATHPEIQQKLFKEIQDVTNNTNGGLTLEMIDRMTYLDAVVKEVLRLYPEGVNIVNRIVTEDTTIGGFQIDQNVTSVLVDVYSIHHNAEFWGPVDTNQFHPDRFLPHYETFTRPQSAFLGFGLGQRSCPGKNFAILEMKVVIAKLLQSFTISPANGDKTPKILPVKVHLVMVPSGPVEICLFKRD